MWLLVVAVVSLAARGALNVGELSRGFARRRGQKGPNRCHRMAAVLPIPR